MALLFASVIFFCARFSARRCIKICKNQKYFLIYLRISEIICNFAPDFKNAKRCADILIFT